MFDVSFPAFFMAGRSLIALGLFFLLSFQSVLAQTPIEISQWEFAEKGSKKFKAAKVPGSLLSDLLSHGMIADPYKGLNEQKARWTEEKSWVYKANFTIEGGDKAAYDLIFEGLDTYASIYVDDSLWLKTNNMFLTYSIPLKNHLQAGIHQLRVEFEPAVNVAKELQKKSPYPYPGDERIYARKAQFQFGWDWGPRLVNCGIWKKVYLKKKSRLPEMQFHIKPLRINDSLAEIQITADFYSTAEMNASLQYSLKQINYKEVDLIKIKKGKNVYQYKISIRNPKLWWCNEAGKAYLYELDLLVQNDTESKKYNFKTGIRSIQLSTPPEGKGNRFVILLNGKEIFCKGANYIPPDALHPEGSEKQIRDLLLLATSNHMNMIRVWGGGVYPPDIFYHLCDSLGLMVWQDFMFACAMYPFDGEYKKNIEEEINQTVLRYRNHTSLVLWCGNNENYEGWTNWGWQKQYGISATDSAKIFGQYLELFNLVIPTQVNRLDPGKPYLSSSPENGWGRPLAYVRGDVHYWGVWWGMAPFESYHEKTGRFVSEYGFQGLPSMTSVKKFGKPSATNWKSSILKAHQKHPRGFETIDQYLQTYFRSHHQFEKSIYLSQVLQAYGLETAIKAHRKAKPICMGTLYWQLNDCWPVISWAATDYFQHKKAAQYSVQKKYINVLPVLEKKDGKINLWLVSDSLQIVEGKLRLTQYNLNGRVENDQVILLKTEAGQNQLLKTFDENYFLKSPFDSMKTFLVARLFLDDKEYSSDCFFFCRPKQLLLQEMAIKQELKATPEGWKLTLRSEVPCFWVSLGTEEETQCSEDFFHLLPFEEKSILLKNKTNPGQKPNLKISSLYENMH
jgi:beta-mannosidase